MRRRHGSGDVGRSPRRRRWQEFRENPRRGIYLLPSALTSGNLFCGFLALILSTQGRYSEAAAAIFVAMVMDLLDGKVARLTKTSTPFGVEYDSLADVVSFCVAPAFLLYAMVLSHFGRVTWLAAFLFAICGALRLARFNVHSGVTDRRYFVGLSTPAAAGVVCSTVLVLDGGEIELWHAAAVSVGTVILALLMVSTFRYYAFKDADFARRRPAGVLVTLLVGALVVVATRPWSLFFLFTAYALSGPSRPVWARRADAALAAEQGTRDTPQG